MRRIVLLVCLLSIGSCTLSPEVEGDSYDIVVYGGTSAGMAAALQADRMGKSVIVLEPGTRIGGLTTGGLGQTDIGNKAAIGGVSREFYQRIRQYYDSPESWNWQDRQEYRDSGQTRTEASEDTMWTFEPSAALNVYLSMVGETGIPIAYEQRLDRESGVHKQDTSILSITMESGETYRGRMFIDATYEGDLMAASGVSYTVGRESQSTYGESLNGVQTANAVHHNFIAGVDPYLEPGNPSSGLLPFVDPEGPGEEHSGDHRVQAYCFRMCLTDHPENRIPFQKPEGYDPTWHELLLRNFEAGEDGMPWINSAMPNRKTDTNNRTGFSTDFIGQNYSYPDASYEEREEILRRHRQYQQGLMWTLANSPRVPKHIREEIARWGTSKDEFEREDGWQNQLYVREARRMIGSYVMTQQDCQREKVADDPIALAAYNMDSHNVQRYMDDTGQVRNEGDVQVPVKPYPISYRAIIPKREQCTNLLVPVCLSASHIAFGSIRMEPVFMVLGQSAATAASLAISDSVDVQDLNYTKLRNRLLQDKQVLSWQQ